jgi:hypothetical protein
LKVNNRDVSQATHLEAVEALLQPTSEVVLLVRHDPQPAGLKVDSRSSAFDLTCHWELL